jgi:hypothetical protein
MFSNAYKLLNGPSIHESFIRELNTRAEKYNDIMAQRKGRSKKNNKKNGNGNITAPETEKK